MATFAEKVSHARSELGLQVKELAEEVGVSTKTIFDYEKGRKRPRQTTLLKLAKALQVSAKFLTDDNCDNPLEDIEKDSYIAAARSSYGARGGRDMDELLNDGIAFFAGGDVPQEDKDKFFDALMSAYVMSKEAAKKKYGRKKEN